jgi:hypothetical protein
MTHVWPLRFANTIVIFMIATSAYSQPLHGHFGWSAHWGSGWIDLDTPVDFRQGEKIELRVGGTATKVLVRFLRKGDGPEDPNGIDGGIVDVQKDRTIVLTLEDEHPSTIQISVHGGAHPWQYDLGGGNGPATLESVVRVQGKSSRLPIESPTTGSRPPTSSSETQIHG